MAQVFPCNQPHECRVLFGSYPKYDVLQRIEKFTYSTDQVFPIHLHLTM